MIVKASIWAGIALVDRDQAPPVLVTGGTETTLTIEDDPEKRAPVWTDL
jgi:hypothetical protein